MCIVDMRLVGKDVRLRNRGAGGVLGDRGVVAVCGGAKGVE
jgi:hypothetical protein